MLASLRPTPFTLGFLLWACAGCVPPRGPSGPTTEGEPDELDYTSDDVILGTAEVRGQVVDLDEQPIDGLSVSLCGLVCQTKTTDSTGNFEFFQVAEGTKLIEPAFAPTAEGELFSDAVRRWSRFFDFVTLADGEQFVFAKPFVLYDVAESAGPLTGEQTLVLQPDLQVSFSADDLLADGPLPAGASALYLGAESVAPADWPTGGLDGWTIQAAWTFSIWDLEAPDAFAVEAHLRRPLAPEQEVAFLVADYTYGFEAGLFWQEAAELASDGVTLRTPPDGGLDRATLWLAVSRP